MMVSKGGKLLRIYILESDRHENMPLYEWIIKQAFENKLAGATVFRGMEGFGVDHRIHTTKILRLSQNLPILIEIVDLSEKVENFIKIIDPIIREGLVTTEKVDVRIYRMVD